MLTFVEEVVKEQGLEISGLVVSGGDVLQEDTLDDASTTPHARNTGVVEVPVELTLRLRIETDSVQMGSIPPWRSPS